MSQQAPVTMRVLLCLVFPIAAWCAPAALAKNDAVSDENLKPLVRVKRTEEQIMFGNHQNNAHFVKKSAPEMSSLQEEEATIDKKSFIDAQTKPEDNDVIQASGVQTPVQMDMDKDQSTKDDDEPSKEASEEADMSEQSSGEEQEEEENQEVAPDGNYLYDYYNYPYGSNYRRRRQVVEKRAAPELLTAESMNNKEELNPAARSKRDLTPEDIYEWLESGQGPRDYYQELEAPDQGDYPWGGLPIAQLSEESVDYPSPNDLDYSLYGDYPEPDADADPKNKDLLSLLEYLVENEAPEETPLAALYPSDIKEEWVEVEEEPRDTVQYEPIVYQGVPGIFIPMEQGLGVSKRQFVIDPGMRKRSGYPGAEGGYPGAEGRYPGVEGGHWGAFVDQQEEKRNAEAYERLVRMAEALNPPQDRYLDELGYKKK